MASIPKRVEDRLVAGIKKFQPVLALATAALVALSFSGCTTTSPVMAASGGAYTITKAGKSGFTSVGSLRKDAYEEATEFAHSKGMEAEVISVNEVPAGFARFPQVDLRFRLMTAASRKAESSSPDLAVSSQASHDAMGNATNADTTVTTAKQIDFYAELKKLGELKERGFLSEEEFQAEKKRLIAARDRTQ